jgi:hypothetical protein
MIARPRSSPFHAQSILLLIFLLTLPAVTTRIYASDEVEGFSWLHSLAFDRDVSFENEYRYFYDTGQVKNPGFRQTFLEDRWTDAGLRPNFTTMGSAILWAPFYAMGHAAALIGDAPADGLSHPYVVAVAIGSAAYGLLALLLSIAIARRLTGDGVPAAIAVWLGTPLLFYMYVTPVFAHACSAFSVALFLWTWVRVRRNWTAAGALALGLAGGLMTIVRAQDALFVAGPALDFLRFAVFGAIDAGAKQERAGLASRRARPGAAAMSALAGLSGFLLAIGPQLLAFKALNGHFRQSEYETRKMSWTSPHGLQVLFDPQHGLFFWTPLAFVAFAGLLLGAVRPTPGSAAPAARELRWVAGLSLIMFALQAYIAGAVESWTVAGAFGQRRFVSITPLVVIGLALLLSRAADRPKWIRPAASAVVVICVWWNLGLMAQFGLHTMDRERLTLRENAWQSFVELPTRAPALAWRYLTDRSSFYNRPRIEPAKGLH